MRTNTTYAALKAGAGAMAVGLALAYSTSAFAQDTTPPADDANEGEAIVVTGTLLRSTANDTPSPVTVLSSEMLDQRGIQTTQEAIQRLASNNGPAVTTSFSANGAFAAGASGISLRGLSTNSTLVLFDGMRAAYYPLADDATRNFVDLNTIPDDIVDRIEVLRDGASSTYGADAIAGVVNVITKKQITGLSGRAEAGITQRGDASTYRLGLTGGFGDLSSDGYNVYASGFYYKQNALYNADRPYPYNSTDLSGICRDGVCGPQVGPHSGSINPSSTGYGSFSTSTDRRAFATTFFVAPYDATNTTRLGRYQFLNPAQGCIAGETPYTLTAAEFNTQQNTAAGAPSTVCQGDLVRQYGVISPNVERFGASLRATKRFGDFEAFIQGNYLQSKVDYSGEPASIRANGPAGIQFRRFSTAGAAGGANADGSFALALPVYVCPLVNGLPQAVCNAGNGQLNPNNPFAAQGQVARILGRIPNLVQYNKTVSQTYRVAAGLTGPLSDKWNLSVNAVGMQTDLERTQNGYVYIQHLLNVVADGSYNFLNPLSNSQSVLDYLSPDNITNSKSKLLSFDANVSGELFDLPGGPLQVAVGGQFRYESIDAPSANADFAGPTERYLVINAFGTKGSREVYSGYAEIDAPVLDFATINASGRYDKYSSGQDAFSPKVGLRVQPIDGVTIRGTWSRGFRIPSFAEANALPTTGFVTATPDIYSAAYLAQYGCSAGTFSSCPTYVRSATYGQTTLASPDLKPERSTSWTASIQFKPMRNVELSVDYYNIKKTGAITTPSNSPALQAYYAGQPIPAGYTILTDTPDPAFPNAQPRVAFVQSQLINANTIRSEGIDFGVRGRWELGNDIWFSTNLEATYIINLSTEFPGGSVESYEGTLGNFNLTAGSGTPEWRGSWQNTLEFKQLSITATVDYFGGYNLSAEDQSGAGTSGDCSLLSTNPNDRYVKCDVPAYITVDLNTSYKVTDRFTFYVNVLNLFDDLPPIDPITYGANNYNPVQGGTGIFGRTIRAGVKFGF
jgi:iron complex outermembrane recepter protein